MVFSSEEKTLILGALFHDIGKFEQRCTGNPGKKYHQTLGGELIKSGRFIDKFIKIIGEDNLSVLLNIIEEHHNKNAQGVTKIVQIADHLSASERVEKEEVEVYQDQWSHKHLASLFSKMRLLNNEAIPPRYYKHKVLTKNEYDVIIPTGKSEEEVKEFAYKESDWNLFLEDLEYVLDIYEKDDAFESLINLLLVIFEKYMWCIPDFTGSSETDISLYNHLKDVAGFSHAIYLTQKDNPNSKNLNLVIGDIPGIQSYIFNVINRKPAKILRGRSIFVQIITRNLATKLLKELGLSESNLIMLAGGKFYIITPDTNSFVDKLAKANMQIESYLFDNFRMELSFNCSYQTFEYYDLMKKDNALTFGHVIEEASHKLIRNRYNLFNNKLFDTQNEEHNNFILDEKYIDDDGSGTDSIKCRVTDKPIRENRTAYIEIPTDSGLENLPVDKQVSIEYNIGSKVVGNNLIAILNEDGLSIDPANIMPIKKYKDQESHKNRIKILLNPTFKEQLKKDNIGKDIFRNTYYLEVANYCSKDDGDEIMPFDKMVKESNGAKFLTLIKGDIDNLGLLMAYGLASDNNDLTGISRTTTLSNHLKYYFSFFLNGFLSNWETQMETNKIYTIFAGGDDLMLIAPQSSAPKLVKALNHKFSEFTCANNEVHISFSITHFKEHTPIRLIADFAEENQKQGKKYSKDSQNKMLKNNTEQVTAFIADNDKAGTFLFNTFIKNKDLDYFIELTELLSKKANDENSGLSSGLIRRLLELSEMLKKYEETNDASYLIAYARLNHTVNRLLKDKDKAIINFFNSVLIINKEENKDAQRLEKILYPLICQVIYNIRN